MTQKATTLWLLVLGAASLFYGCTEEEPLSANYTIGTLEVSVPEKNAKGDNYDMGPATPSSQTSVPSSCLHPVKPPTMRWAATSSSGRDTCYRPYCPDSLSCTDVALTSENSKSSSGT